MNTMRTKGAVWPLALLATAFLLGCQEQASSPVEPESSGPLLHVAHGECEAHNKNDDGCGDSGESATVEFLSGGYSTPGPQDIKFAENGRRVIVRTEDGAQIQYSVNITLPFDEGSCVWSGFGDDASTAAEDAEEFWDDFPFADALPKNLLFRVNKKAEGEPDGEHRTEARWWVEDPEKDPDADDARVMYLVKVGVPGKVLADQLRELPEFDFEPATGTINGTVVEITGGAVRLSRHFCGAATEGTAGCGPQAPTLEVACINPPGDQVFTATVTP